jgi:ammonium transporter, Amt family
LWGFSLTFSDTASPFIGDFRQYDLNTRLVLLFSLLILFDTGYIGLKGVLEKPSIGSARVPSIVYCVFQLMFAALT